MNPYTDDNTRLIDRLKIDADAVAAKATHYSALLSEAKATLAKAEAAFTAELSQDRAADLINAQSQVRDFTVVVEAIENAGGVSEARDRALRTPAVFAAFAAGFKERASVLEKLVQPALKRIGQLRAELTEQGMAYQMAEIFPDMVALKTYHGSVVAELGEAKIILNYCEKRGEKYAPRTFQELYSALTLPLPVAPAV